MEDLSGTQLGQYELRNRLGEGGMGTVYLGYQPTLRREVAIKVISKQIAADPDYLERFTREARTVAALDHPHIVTVHDYGEQGEVTYIVMNLLKGGSLEDRFKAKEPFALPEIAKLLAEMAAALDYAHNSGVIHRDIKPSNIMFDHLGNSYLVDFGIARLMAATSALTEPDALLGTPMFMSPEQWRGEQLTGASDQYSMACVVYQMVTGKPPFEAAAPFALLHKHINETAQPAHHANPEVPEQVAEVLERAMAKTPDERYPTMKAFAVDFGDAIRWAAPEPSPANARTAVSDRGESSPTKMAATRQSGKETPSAPNRVWVWAGAVIALVVIVGGVLAFSGVFSPTPTPEIISGVTQDASTTPDTLETAEVLAQGQNDAASDPDTTVNPATDDLWMAWNGGEIDHETAIARLTDAVSANPNDAIAWLRRGIIYHEMGDYDSALADLTRSIALEPTADALEYRGGIYFSREEWDAAFADYTEVVENLAVDNPNYAGVYENRGLIHYWVYQDYEAALADFIAAARNPGYINAYRNAGDALFELGRYDEALDWYKTYVQADAANADPAVIERIAQLETFTTAAADLVCEEGLSAEDFINAGNASRDNGAYKAAADSYTCAIRVAPEDRLPYYLRGLNYLSLEVYQPAFNDFSRAIEIDPQYSFALNERAQIFASTEDYELALQDLEVSVAADPENAGTYWLLGNLYFTLAQAFAADGDDETAQTKYGLSLENYQTYVQLFDGVADTFVTDRIAEIEAILAQ